MVYPNHFFCMGSSWPLSRSLRISALIASRRSRSSGRVTQPTQNGSPKVPTTSNLPGYLFIAPSRTGMLSTMASPCPRRSGHDRHSGQVVDALDLGIALALQQADLDLRDRHRERVPLGPLGIDQERGRDEVELLLQQPRQDSGEGQVELLHLESPALDDGIEDILVVANDLAVLYKL